MHGILICNFIFKFIIEVVLSFKSNIKLTSSKLKSQTWQFSWTWAKMHLPQRSHLPRLAPICLNVLSSHSVYQASFLHNKPKQQTKSVLNYPVIARIPGRKLSGMKSGPLSATPYRWAWPRTGRDLKWILSRQTGVAPAASSGPDLSVSYMQCNSALEELGFRRLFPVVLHFDFCFQSLIFLL